MNRYPNIQNLNTIVPIVKHYEVCEQNYINFKGDVNPLPINGALNMLVNIACASQNIVYIIRAF